MRKRNDFAETPSGMRVEYPSRTEADFARNLEALRAVKLSSTDRELAQLERLQEDAVRALGPRRP
jgi:hypothetical protein